MKAFSLYFYFAAVSFASILFFTGCQAPADGDAQDYSAMESGADKFLNAWNSHDVSDLSNFMTEDFQRWENGKKTVNNLGEMKALMNGNFSMSSDAKVDLGGTTYHENKAYVHWTYSGTNDGPIDEGIPATGNSFSVDGFAIHTYNDEGMLAKEEVYFDTWSMNEQLGFKMMPPTQVEAAADADAESEEE